jgi:fructose-1-phosphate kinase PfkB-like protein
VRPSKLSSMDKCPPSSLPLASGPLSSVHNQEYVHEVDSVLCSAIGAGDTFVAGALYGLLCRRDDWTDQMIIRFAVNLATTKIQQDGFEGLASKMPPADD